jgi:hypothetical protein
MVFRYGSHSAPSGSRKSCLHAFKWGTTAWHIRSCCKAFPHLLLYSVVCPLPFHTSRSSVYFLTKAIRFHCQRMLHDILGDDSHGFVHGIQLAMSVELMLCYSSLWGLLYIFYWTICGLSCVIFLTRPLLLYHFRSLSTIVWMHVPDLQMCNLIKF